MVSLELIVEIINEGITKAFNVKMSGYVTTDQIDPMIEPSFLGSDLILPKVVGAHDAEHPLRVAIAQPGLETFSFISTEEARKIATGQKMPRIIGMLLYDDIFGSSHRTPFHFAWAMTCDEDGPVEARWIDFSLTAV